ncbi:uncharacterized protein LOC131878409 isoform X1 [Tigriopus californicus]|uniref:uncharacterized protein LOC131878409 isoform X1 n=1 Tax=Tigriopus californicus TaxID=6832 RepID=UPI0027DAB189|nr:uncharacterized protein LOC131878409 isoform X1 [Tigriopus californicus]
MGRTQLCGTVKVKDRSSGGRSQGRARKRTPNACLVNPYVPIWFRSHHHHHHHHHRHHNYHRPRRAAIIQNFYPSLPNSGRRLDHGSRPYASTLGCSICPSYSSSVSPRLSLSMLKALLESDYFRGPLSPEAPRSLSTTKPHVWNKSKKNQNPNGNAANSLASTSERRAKKREKKKRIFPSFPWWSRTSFEGRQAQRGRNTNSTPDDHRGERRVTGIEARGKGQSETRNSSADFFYLPSFLSPSRSSRSSRPSWSFWSSSSSLPFSRSASSWKRGGLFLLHREGREVPPREKYLHVENGKRGKGRTIQIRDENARGKSFRSNSVGSQKFLSGGNDRQNRQIERNVRSKRSRSFDRMLAPPVLLTTPSPDDGQSNFLTPHRFRDQRSNSCVSDSAALISPDHRRPSTISCGPTLARYAGPGPGPQRAYLIRERATGEETVVTMSGVRSPVVGARTIVNKIPSFYANAQFVSQRPGGRNATIPSGPLEGGQNAKCSSFDDEYIQYNSLMSSSDYKRRFSEMLNAQDVIAANRLEKVYQQYRRQAHAASDDTMRAASDKLDEWMMHRDIKRRRSCAVGDFATQTSARSKTPFLMPQGRISRAHSQAGTGLDIPNSATLNEFLRRNSSRRSTRSAKCYPGGTRSRRESVFPGGGGGGLGANNNHSKRNGYNNTDVELAAERLKAELAVEAGLIPLTPVDDDDFAPPSEKERQRIVLIVSCVALAITVLAASLVGLSLGMSHMLEELNPKVQRQFNASFSTTSTLEFDLDPGENQDTIYANEEVLKGESIQDLESSSISHEDESNLLNAIAVATSQKLRSFKAGKVDLIGSDKVKFNNFERLLGADDESISMS